MTGEPVWFGDQDRARFGMWHLPPDRVAAASAVVLCPPLGYEAVCAHAALRDLGDLLAARGVAALRMEYDGTGNSLGEDSDPDRVPSWLASVRDAVHHARERGHRSVLLLGVRIGATLAAEATDGLEEGLVDGLVLWDPAWSGRHYARALTMLAAAGDSGGRADGGVSLAGELLTDEALTGLKRLRVRAESLPGRVLVVQPAEGRVDGAYPELPPHWETRALPGTAALLDTDVELAQVPTVLLEEVAAWIGVVVGDERPLLLPSLPVPATVVEQTPDGPLRHEAVRIGPRGELFATITSGPDVTPGAGVVMLNNGAAPQVGPGRVWVSWARDLAHDGLLVARLDIAGLGDSPPRPGTSAHETYPVGAGQDVAVLTGELRSRGVERVAVLGLCSGALLGYDALITAPEVEAVVSINARFDRPAVDRWRDRRWRAGGRTSRLLAVPLSKTPLLPLFDRVPTFVWRLLALLHLVAPASLPLRRVHEREARALLVFGEHEWGRRALKRRISRRDREQVLDGERVQSVVVPGLDHSMFVVESRPPVLRAVRDFLRAALGSGPAPE